MVPEEPKTAEPRTICVGCKHMMYGGPKNEIWYCYTCAASVATEEHTNPVTGKTVPTEYRHCRDVNKGDCDLYEPGRR